MKRIILLLLALILITGCAQFTMVSSKLPGLPQKAEPGLITATQSVTTEVKNPREDETVSSRYELAPVAIVTDMGHADSEGAVCIQISEDTFKGSFGCECQDFAIYAYEEDGEVQQQLEFGPYGIQAEEEKEELMTATTRYTYETTGTAKACIKKDIYDAGGCQLENIGGGKKNLLASCSNGAIKITKVTEDIKPVDDETVTLVFNAEVEKAKEGDIYDYDKAGYPSCRAEERQNKQIRGELKGLPGGDVRCKETELEEGEGTVVCEAKNIRLFDTKGNFLFPGDSYEPEIEINLKYGYEQIQSMKFVVVPEF